MQAGLHCRRRQVESDGHFFDAHVLDDSHHEDDAKRFRKIVDGFLEHPANLTAFGAGLWVIDVGNWQDVAWALATRMDSSRDLTAFEGTPIDYLDFASPEPGLGGKLVIDATNKIGAETHREWGNTLELSDEVQSRIDTIWPRIAGSFNKGERR